MSFYQPQIVTEILASVIPQNPQGRSDAAFLCLFVFNENNGGTVFFFFFFFVGTLNAELILSEMAACRE